MRNDLELIRANVNTERFWLPIPLTNGNDGRTKHFGASAAKRKKYGKGLGFVFKGRRPYSVPVRVTVVRILGPREHLWDSSSGLRGNYKEVEDALVEAGLFHNDSPSWILETRFFQDGDQRTKGPAIELLVTR